MYQKKCSVEESFDLLLIGVEGKKNAFLSNVLIHLCMIIHYIVIGNIFAVIVHKLSVQKKY